LKIKKRTRWEEDQHFLLGIGEESSLFPRSKKREKKGGHRKGEGRAATAASHWKKKQGTAKGEGFYHLLSPQKGNRSNSAPPAKKRKRNA